MTRQLNFAQSVNEAIDLSMAKDKAVYIMGLGVPDPKGVFGTTSGLQEKYGDSRVMDMPIAENGMTGIAVGAALAGMRPILVHQRVDFAVLAMEQISNQAANWHYMFGGKKSVPMVVRVMVGRGWGQGPQHSQSLQSWFAHVPGLKVVMPATPHDAKGLLISSIEDNNPVIFLEHRWLHSIIDNVPEGLYRVPIGKAKVLREGKDLTIVAASYMVLEANRAAQFLSAHGVDVEVIDLRTIKPLDTATIIGSVRKTGRLIAADTGWKTCGVAGEIVALASEEAFSSLKCAPIRVTLPDCPTPTTPALANLYYPGTATLVDAAVRMLKLDPKITAEAEGKFKVSDVPDTSFKGPF